MTVTNENRRPVLTQGPNDAFVVRNVPASLSCRALYAERISFKCNGEWVSKLLQIPSRVSPSGDGRFKK